MRGPDGEGGGRLARELPSPVPPHPLDPRITPDRARKYRQVLARRTGRLAIVVEDCFDPHNATAITRTCDACGVHRVVVTTARNRFKVNRQVSQGVHRYLDLQILPGIAAAAAWLRGQGYRILVTDLAAGAAPSPAALRPQLAAGPIALVFGNEGHGISDEARALADGAFLIPMAGFSQSLNLSVSVAMTLWALRGDELGADAPGDLPAAEQIASYDRWIRAYCGEEAEDPRARGATGRHGEDLAEFAAPAPPSAAG
jgi:tRNA (guanosine-2'-O-)-methyltransferase